MDKRTLMKMAVAALLTVSASSVSAEDLKENRSSDQQSSLRVSTDEGIWVRFLGTGAADWDGKDERGEWRRWASILVDGHILVDFTPTVVDMLPEGARPDIVFYTHSHGDHYNPGAALKVGVKQVYLSQTWYDKAVSDFQKEAQKLKLPMPEIIPLIIGQKVKIDNLVFTAAPADHATGLVYEQSLLYLLEKGDTRVLYATDTARLPSVATKIIGIDAHLPEEKRKPINGFIMEATMGLGHETDWRYFAHADVSEVVRTVKVLCENELYLPPAGQPVYLTHMARWLHGTQAELDAQLPSPLKAAYDGLEVVFKPTR